jgi:uncharacterized protein YyaL (SSP411 family)
MNRLALESSPYLQQHAHNPVDWYPWGEEALEKARSENKPILVSIGYSTCHWCHVMERESFEDPQVADFMNEHFVNIKVDREERPDVDQVYMDAVQAMTGSGGWPLNCFLLPDGRPYYGGTYFPPRPAHSRPSWMQVLASMDDAFRNKREVVEGQAEKLMGYLQQDGMVFSVQTPGPAAETEEGQNPYGRTLLEDTYYHLRDRFDRVEGGFGGAPKFPGSMGIEFLLRYHRFTGNTEALEHAELSLAKMIQGGIYDQLGGGFARYATDRAWLVPHFEKMLYDNALLVSVLADAHQLTGKPLYRETIEETLAYVQREMTHPEGGFFSAQDADSEGVEGKFFVWEKKEVEQVLGEDAELFCRFYDVTEEGNWEEHSILHRPFSFEEFSEKNQVPLDELRQKLDRARQKLFAERSLRVAPGLDDKGLLDWNALMVSAFAKAYTALGHEPYRKTAVRALDFLLRAYRQTPEGLRFFHTWKNGRAKTEAFLDDYANLIAALLDVYAIDFDRSRLETARDLSLHVREHFYDEADGFFHFAPPGQKDLVLRKKDFYDNATPSGNSTMVHNLFRLALYTGNRHRERETALRLLGALREGVKRYPNAFARYASAFFWAAFPAEERAVIGPNAHEQALSLQKTFAPNTVTMASPDADPTWPLLADRPTDGRTVLYICRDYACQAPVVLS